MIKQFSSWLTFDVFKIAPDSLLGGAVSFFVYDTIKIFLLLAGIIFTISVIRSFLPPEKIRAALARKNKYAGHILAALVGIVTPFCSCSAVPLFLGFVRAGVPLGVTFSFLVSSPMINEIALVMLLGMFGWKIALLYIGSGLVIAVVSGLLIGGLKVENLLTDIARDKPGCAPEFGVSMSWPARLAYAREYTLGILGTAWPYILIGVGAGAWMHGYLPANALARYAGADNWYAVPLATLLGIPLYANCAGALPLISALTEKGMAMGTALAFMMAVTGLSLPEFMILKTVMKLRLIVIFAGIVGTGIIFTGYFFNFIIH